MMFPRNTLTAFSSIQRINSSPASSWLSPLFFAVIFLCFSPSSPAQPTDAPVASAPPAQAPLVDESHAKLIHQRVETWVQSGGEKDAAFDSQAIWASDVSALRVTLRYAGVTLASGSAMVEPLPWKPAPGSDANQPVVDLAALAQRAARAALEILRQSSAERYRNQPSTFRDYLSQVSVDIQIARRPEPIQIPLNDPPNAILLSYAPHYHGLILLRERAADDRPVWSWPVDALVANMAPFDQLASLAAQAGFKEEVIPHLARTRPAPGVQINMARFTVLHVVRPTRNDPPMLLTRGQALLPATSLNTATIHTLAHRMADFLIRRQKADGSFPGVYNPALDQFESPSPDGSEAALALYALSQRHLFLSSNHSDDPQLPALEKSIQAGLAYLLPDSVSRPPALVSPGTAALTLLTLNSTPLAEPFRKNGAQARLTDKLLKLHGDEPGFAAAFNSSREPAGLPTRALILAALASSWAQTQNPDLRKIIDQELADIWSAQDLGSLATAMPWLGKVDFLLLHPQPSAALPNAELSQLPPHRAGQLLALAKALRFQIVRQAPAPNLGSPDVVGGFDVIPRSLDSAPYPEWRSALFLAFLAETLGQPEFRNGPDRYPWLLDCSLAARFLGQLMFSESSTFYVRSREDVLGGIRSAPWDQRVGNNTTSIALLAVTTLQATLQQMQQEK